MKFKINIFALSLIIGLSSMTASASGLQTVNPRYVSSNYAKTKYPIVFNHGMFGFTRLGPSSFGIDYFYQILPDLARNGAKVYATQVSPLESTQLRGEQLLQQVDEVIALTGSPKVNLIGHSHGGPTIRYIEIVAPTKVASLTAVAGAIKGSKIADDILSNRGANTLLTIFSQHILAPVITLLEGNPSLPLSLNNSLQSVSEKGAAEFNAKYPSAAIPKDCGNGQKVTADGVYHYSWTGTAQFTNIFDVMDGVISTLAPLSYKNLDNDGLMNRCNTHYGQVIRDNYRQTHLDEINHVLGLRGIFFAPNPLAQYRQHANRLKLQGL